MTTTIAEAKEILKENPYNWCDESVDEALSFLDDYSDSDTLEDIKEIPSEWAYYWAWYVERGNY